MCSYQNNSDPTFGNFLKENWEETLWDNIFSPNSTSSNTSVPYFHVSDVAVQTITERHVNSTSQEYQVDIPTTYQNVEPSPMLSPAWEGSISEVPQSCTNMSTYFSTFNPTSQFQDVPVHQTPVRKLSFGNIQNTNINRKMHQARINLVSTGNGKFKAIVKRKRKRTVFTTEQLEILEEVYSKKPYVTRDERQILVQQLQVNDKSVKIWFQNRRLKNKKGDQDTQDDKCSIFDRLNTVESQIIERTDEFGFVTLDDKIMNDLVNVIDDYFSNNASPVECKNETNDSPVYEPISPASTSDNSCEESDTTWQHHETSNIVQELMELESILSN